MTRKRKKLEFIEDVYARPLETTLRDDGLETLTYSKSHNQEMVGLRFKASLTL